MLFVCEGEKREPHLLKVIDKFFLSVYDQEESTVQKKKLEQEKNYVVAFGCHIQSLASLVEERSRDFPGVHLKDSIDLVALLKELKKDSLSDDIHKITSSSEVSEIYLFFDCDLHDTKQDLGNELDRINSLLTLFDNERIGKLYLSYPMIEALCYTKALPDDHFSEYVCRIDECVSFKKRASDFSDYDNHDFVMKMKPPRGENTKLNWCSLIRQHRRKAQELCDVSTGSELTQMELFQVQCDKHITPRGEVAILASMPLFLYDYFNEAERKELGFSLEE
jgi:hypothetical protein